MEPSDATKRMAKTLGCDFVPHDRLTTMPNTPPVTPLVNEGVEHPDLTYVQACRDSLNMPDWQPNRAVWADLCDVALAALQSQPPSNEARLREARNSWAALIGTSAAGSEDAPRIVAELNAELAALSNEGNG